MEEAEMNEVKNYGKCEFCGCEETSDYKTVCPSCLKKWDPVEHLYLFDEATEEAFRKISQESVDKNKDSHIYEFKSENIPNYREADIIDRIANKNKEDSMTIALQARRSEALRMAYYTSHKLGHFSMKIPGDDLMTEKQKFEFNVKEVKEIARNNLKFILEG